MMSMPQTSDELIADLVGQLQPVRPLRFRNGLGSALAAIAASIVAVALLLGLRADISAGHVDPVLLLSMGPFLVLGLACTVSVIVMSRPRVGSDHRSWRWAAAMTALVPVAALVTGFDRVPGVLVDDGLLFGLKCLVMGAGSGLLTAAVLVWWLRRGAPISPDKAGLLVGIAAGSIGTFAYSLHCSISDFVHIGLWHSATVVMTAIIGRLFVPRLVRW